MDIPPSNRTIADRVRVAMAGAAVSEVALADATGVPRTTLRRRLTGNSAWLSDELTAISAHLNVRLLDLLADEEAVA